MYLAFNRGLILGINGDGICDVWIYGGSLLIIISETTVFLSPENWFLL